MERACTRSGFRSLPTLELWHRRRAASARSSDWWTAGVALVVKAATPSTRQRLPPLACIGLSSSDTDAVGGGNSNGDSGHGSGGGGGGSGDGFRTSALPAKSAGADADDSAGSQAVVILDVGGMSCGGCASSVKNILESQVQVNSATVNLVTETAIVHIRLDVLRATSKQEVAETLAKHLTSCGFKSTVREQGSQSGFQAALRKREERELRLKETGRKLAAAWALVSVCIVGHASHLGGKLLPRFHFFHSVGFHMSLCLASLAGPGRGLLLDGWRSFHKRNPNMNTLVGLGAISSFSVSVVAACFPKLGWRSFFEEPVMLLAFVLLGRAVEERAKIQASSDMESLLSLVPKTARLVMGHDCSDRSPSTLDVPSGTISSGDRVLVLPGDVVPVDGVVKEGKSMVDESSLTGEPLPVLKTQGDEVNAGTLNYNGVITIEARCAGGETIVADIVRMVEGAQSRVAPVQRLADKVAGQFCYGVMALSLATFAFWSTLGPRLFPLVLPTGNGLLLGLQLACNVLVIACPCALGLATPTAVLVGTSLGAKTGLLIRGGDILERASYVDTVVFDKTGTLTVGRPVVTEVVLGNDWTKEEVLRLAHGVERKTSHPLAKAIVEAAEAIGCVGAFVEDGSFEQVPGSGATAVVEGRRVSVGTLDWIERHGATEGVPEPQSGNSTLVYVGVDNCIAGTITLADRTRDNAALAITALRKLGISTFLLSGDRWEVTRAVAKSVGIDMDKVYAEERPRGKAELISRMQKEKKIVAMVGDGINDAAALAQADVGMAMATSIGAASEAASIVLMRDNLFQVVHAIELSRKTQKRIKQNLWWAFMYNIIGLPVAAGALVPITKTTLTPSLAGALMGLSSLGVMANSLMLNWECKPFMQHIPVSNK